MNSGKDEPRFELVHTERPFDEKELDELLEALGDAFSATDVLSSENSDTGREGPFWEVGISMPGQIERAFEERKHMSRVLGSSEAGHWNNGKTILNMV